MPMALSLHYLFYFYDLEMSYLSETTNLTTTWQKKIISTNELSSLTALNLDNTTDTDTLRRCKTYYTFQVDTTI